MTKINLTLIVVKIQTLSAVCMGERLLEATEADRLLAVDPRGALGRETLTRRGGDILPALHFTSRLILSQGR